MIPIGDENPGRTRYPYVNYSLILVNVLVFVFFQGIGNDQRFLMSYSMVPAEIITGLDYFSPGPGGLGPSPYPVHLTLFTSMFMHGSMGHIFGNMLYLWVFGDNLENRMGHLRYLIFYLLCGLLASFCHIIVCYTTNSALFIPTLGASGAISAVLGGYLLLFPRNAVRVLVMIWQFRIPAFLVLGLWIAFQLFSGYNSIGVGGGGVAYAAHIGGFFAGMLLVKLFIKKEDVILVRDEDPYRM